VPVFKISPHQTREISSIKISQISVIWNKDKRKYRVKRVYRNRSYDNNKKSEARFNSPFCGGRDAYFLLFSVQNKYLLNECFCSDYGPTYDEFLLHLTITTTKNSKDKKIYYNLPFKVNRGSKEVFD